MVTHTQTIHTHSKKVSLFQASVPFLQPIDIYQKTSEFSIFFQRVEKGNTELKWADNNFGAPLMLIEFVYFLLFANQRKSFSFQHVTNDILVCVANSDVSVLRILIYVQRPMGDVSANQDSWGKIVQKVYRTFTH